MRILLLHPNYHSGGAEIAGNWPPAWVTYLQASSAAPMASASGRPCTRASRDLSPAALVARAAARSVAAADRPVWP